jgi:hypothetical protein
MLQKLKVKVDDDIVKELLCLKTVVVLIGDADIARTIRRILTVLDHLLLPWSPVPAAPQVHSSHLALQHGQVLGGTPYKDLIGIFALKFLDIASEMLFEDSFVILGESLRQDGDPLLGLIVGLHVQEEALAVGHLQGPPGSDTGGRGDVQEEQRHRLAEMCQHLQHIRHGDVDSDHLSGVDDGWDFDLNPLVRDRDLLLGQDLVVPDPDGPAGQGAPLARMRAIHNVSIGDDRPFTYNKLNKDIVKDKSKYRASPRR